MSYLNEMGVWLCETYTTLMSSNNSGEFFPGLWADQALPGASLSASNIMTGFLKASEGLH